MKICIPCQSPGGLDAAVVEPLEESEILDYYEVHDDRNFEHTAQMRGCLGGCSDPVEAITRRGVEAVIVAGISPRSLMLFRNAGIKVLRADNPVVRSLIDSFIAESLEEIGVKEFAAQRRNG